ncbi:MAG: bifunctional demethylmenaquinone methyltransferase/2-methoxy-6-polyprenyl-1,4-benzoquinol methylase UbiE [Saprospiraceae bacterium]|nr:bifunctional demethylmenaquinone methyltransferase/2-methoxy-6-polyprenyl-1,4-benzoquinol methylase UbiE [Saprospiraceae bacterium]MCF8249344.1 bifunctional demethylmenaquinone methyltransferase/2-methoxy-6-polyprenyl-1,4-benzoquinol methylase UbiE [Saprospiraceae bacterium]MCF8311379.1 bifunctional demethylmenaquinone methyltransferase/2-methoxy-6-polyprenyl-1,4-benzoquinol methylase UbiE [Saprospiraceae bacterium]MCF8439963.1 bifunctional demethylmenaquinone methyltransferase/2-methoxy-6-po
MALEQEVKPYNEQESKKSQVSTMFDNIAPWYDFLNHFLSLGIDISWRRKTIRELRDLAPQNILDVATGTGDLAIEAERQLNPKKIIGIDISNEMLEVGRTKLLKNNLSSTIELQIGDSENIAFPDNSFDAVTVAFGVRNFENLNKGLAEILRVIRPGGKAAILEFSKPTVFPFKQLYNFYFKNFLPVIGRITSKDPKAYSYLYESVQAFPDSERFVNLLCELGFKSVDFKPFTLGICTLYIATK